MRQVSKAMRRDSLDVAAIGASAACMIHCLVLPLLFAALPAASQLVDLPDRIHLIAFILAVPVSAAAMVGGYRRHGAIHPIAMAVGGLLLIGIGAPGGLTLALEIGLSVLGSIVLAAGHVTNWRLRIQAIGAGACRFPPKSAAAASTR